MEEQLPEGHPDLLRIVQAAHRDIAPQPAPGEGKRLGNALALALGKTPGCAEDLENIEFLVHVLSVNRAAGAIDDESFEQLLQRIETQAGRADLANRFAQELEAEQDEEDEA